MVRGIEFRLSDGETPSQTPDEIDVNWDVFLTMQYSTEYRKG